MATVLFYFSILLSTTFLIYLRDKGKGKLEYYTFTATVFLIIFIISAIRYDVGVDYLNYIHIYEYILYEERIEPAYYLLNRVLYYLEANSQWVFVISSLIFTALTIKSYPRKKAWIFHLGIILIFYLHSFNIVRQSIATAFCLLAVSNYLVGNRKKFFILTIIGSLFHISALSILTVGSVAIIPLRKHLKESVLPTALIISIIVCYFTYNLFVLYLEQILEFLDLSYLSYTETKYFDSVQGGFGIGIIIKLTLSSYIIANAKLLLENNQYNWLIILLTFVYAVFTILAGQIQIFNRVQILFALVLPFNFYLLLTLPRKRLINIIFISLILTILFLDYYRIATDQSGKFNPYRTIFSIN